MKKFLLITILIASVTSLQGQICNPTVFTLGPNAIGVGGSIDSYRQNCLTYNSDLNAVLWVQRASPLWNFSGNTSGAVQATWLNVTTSLWDSMIIYRDSANHYAARYPGGVFFNPIGNTSISNARVVGTGPVVNNVNWTGIWYSDRQISGSYHNVNSALDSNKFCANGDLPFGNISPISHPLTLGTIDFLNADIQQAVNHIFVGSTLIDPSSSALAVNDIYGGTIAKYNGFVWTRDTIVPGFYFNNYTGYANDEEGARLAFSPDGQIGYAMFLGRLVTSFGNNTDSTLSPIVYKTTNAGATWSSTSIIPGYDWSVGHPEVLKNVGRSFPTQKSNQYKLYAGHGIDLTVDSTGTLHIVGVVCEPYKGSGANPSVDSLMYSNNYHWDYKNYHPVIWDFMTDGTTWNTIMVDSIMTSSLNENPIQDTTGINPWSGGNLSLSYGARVQVSRSVTGGKIFYSWADADTNITHCLADTFPDIYMKSYDINKQKVTSKMNITSGIGRCFFHCLSNVSYYDNTLSGWVAPLVYTTKRNNSYPFASGGADTINYNYLNCAVFYDSQYTDTTHLYRSAGASGIKNYTAANLIVQNYPNPFSQTTNVVVTLKQSNPINLKVYDVMGNLICIKNKNGLVGENTFIFDGSSLQAGIYYYTITINEASVSNKMIIQK